MKPDDKELLEALMDRYSIARIIGVMGEICGEKAEHIATNWQDAPLAKQWDKAAVTLEQMKLDILNYHLGLRDE